MSGAVKGILKRALHQAFALFSLAGKPNIVPNDHSGWTALMAAAARGHARPRQYRGAAVAEWRRSEHQVQRWKNSYRIGES